MPEVMDNLRLDFLERTNADVEHTRSLVVVSWEHPRELKVQVAKSLRAAIDAAMEQESA